MTSLEWISTSRSEDLATLALRDLAAAAGDAEYRLIGGHMVNFHQALHPDVKVDSRSTADADAGIACQAVIANRFDASLRAMGYDRPEGNRFTRHSGSGILTIDVLVDDSAPKSHNIKVGSITADAAQGLSLALAREPVWVNAVIELTTTEIVKVCAPIPDLATALSMKVLAWQQRRMSKDASDVQRLLTIANARGLRVTDLPGNHTAMKVRAILTSSFASGRTATRDRERQLQAKRFLQR